MSFRWFLGFVFVSLISCGETAPRAENARILLLGDSMMAFNRGSGAAVSDAIEDQLGEEVVDRSVPSARINYALPVSGAAGLSIPKQVIDGPWEWVVMNGYGNDILFGCGCRACDRQVDRLISADGLSGSIPEFVASLRARGAKVIYSGYLRTPGVQAPVESCGIVGDELDRRLALMAAADNGVTFVAMSDLVPYGDRSYHGLDLIHPSPKGSQAIGARIAEIIAAND